MGHFKYGMGLTNGIAHCPPICGRYVLTVPLVLLETASHPSLKFSHWGIWSWETERDEDEMIFIMAHIVCNKHALIYRLNVYNKLNSLQTNKTHDSLNVRIYDYMIGKHKSNHRSIYVSFFLFLIHLTTPLYSIPGSEYNEIIVAFNSLSNNIWNTN